MSYLGTYISRAGSDGHGRGRGRGHSRGCGTWVMYPKPPGHTAQRCA